MKDNTSVNILVVDDQPSKFLTTQAALQTLGHKITVAKTIKEAVNKLQEEQFVTIILDLAIPTIDSFKIAKSIRDNSKISHLPLLFFIENEREIKAFNEFNLDTVDYLIKPISPDILQSKISLLARLYQQQQQLEEANHQLEHQVIKLEQINDSLQVKIKENFRLQPEICKIEQEVRESEQFYRTILHNISDSVLITNAEGDFTFICPNTNIIFGYSDEEIREMGNIKNLFKQDLIKDHDLDYLEEINNLEYQIVDKFDCLHFLLINIKKVSINEGTILYTCRDITERKQSQLALEKRQQYFNILVKLQQQLLIANRETFSDPDLLEPLGKVTQTNRVFIYGCDQQNSSIIYPKLEWCTDNIDGTANPSQFNSHSIEAFSFMVEKLIRGEVASGIVADLPAKEKQLLEINDVKSFLIFPLKIMGRFYGYLGFVDCLREKHWDSLEVSLLWLVAAAFASTLERIAIAKELQQSQTRLQNIINNTSDGLLVVDQNGIVQFLNPTAESLFDLPKEQLLGKYIGFLSGKKGVEIQIHQASGKMIITEMRVTDIIWDHQPAILASLRDITQRRHIEENWQQSLQELYAMKYALDQASIVVMTDEKGVITYVNDKFCEISEYSEEELIGTRHEPVHGNYHSRDFWRNLWQTVSKGEIWRGEIQNNTKNGGIYWVDTTIVPFLNAQGRPERYLAIRFDITDRKKAEQSLKMLNEDLENIVAQRTENLALTNKKLRQEILERKKAELALRDSQAQLQDLLGNANDIIQSLSLPDGRFIYVNEAWHRTLGYSLEDIENMTIFDLIESSYQEYYLNIFTKLKKGEISSASQVEVAMVSKDRTNILLEGSINCRQQNGQPVATRAIFRDVTEQKRIQKAIAASEAQLQAIFKNAAVGIALTTTEGRIVKVNQAFTTMLGYHESHLLQMNLVDFTHPDDLGVSSDIFKKLLTGERESCHIKERYLCADGKTLWGQLTISLIYKAYSLSDCDRENDGDFIVAIVEDITEQVMAEQEIQKNLAKERELNQLKDQFINIVSHEFRTPLTSILGYAELLIKYQDKFTSEKKQTHLQRIETAGKQMKTLIEDVLCLSRVDAGKTEFQPQPIDVVTFCQDLIEELQVGIGQNHKLQLDYPDQLVLQKVDLDKKLLHHILTNLLTNSIKYSPSQSTINLSVEIQSRMIIFFVKDRGIGVPVSDQVHLFESFHRAENADHIQGTGLGLNIVQRYVNLHRGNIIFSSIIGEGTTFRLALPLTNSEIGY